MTFGPAPARSVGPGHAHARGSAGGASRPSSCRSCGRARAPSCACAWSRAFALLVLAKLITVQVPFFFKAVVDRLSEARRARWRCRSRRFSPMALPGCRRRRLQRAARRRLRQGRPACRRAGWSLTTFRTFQPVAALSPGAAHRRARARRRARHRRRSSSCWRHAVQRRADAVRVRARLGILLARLRWTFALVTFGRSSPMSASRSS